MGLLRWGALIALVMFVAFTLYSAGTESFWGSIKKIWALRWGKQVTFDLYLGLLLFGAIVYFSERSAAVALAWLLPSLALGNIVPLLYFVLRFEHLVATFGG